MLCDQYTKTNISIKIFTYGIENNDNNYEHLSTVIETLF